MFDDRTISVIKFKDHHKQMFRNFCITEEHAYIGRGSPLGNPYSSKVSKHEITKVADSEEAISRFKDDLYNRKLKPEAYEMLGHLIQINKTLPITLVCFCKPNPCHGDVIRGYIENKGKRDE